MIASAGLVGPKSNFAQVAVMRTLVAIVTLTLGACAELSHPAAATSLLAAIDALRHPLVPRCRGSPVAGSLRSRWHYNGRSGCCRSLS